MQRVQGAGCEVVKAAPEPLHPTPHALHPYLPVMPDYHYLIIGGGMAADAAARGIRELDRDRDIGILTEETDPPYSRPPLTKRLWKPGGDVNSVWCNTAELNVAIQPGKRVTRVDRAARQVTDHRGAVYGYHRLLFATGARPRKLVAGGEQVIYYRTLADYRRVRDFANQQRRFVVIGGGFIGAELSAALAGAGCEVTLLFPEQALGARIYPLDLARHLGEYYAERGVTVAAGQSVLGMVKRGRAWTVRTLSGADIPADVVIAGLGVQPNEEIAAAAGLAVENGIVVDDRLRAGHPDVFAAGDVAAFASAALGRRIRVEHEDAALTMGRYAGRAMAGADDPPFAHLPFFYSDMFDLGYEAVGTLDGRLQVVAEWKEKYREGFVYYLEGDRVRGVLCWGVFGKVDRARELIADPGPWDAGKVVGAIKSA